MPRIKISTKVVNFTAIVAILNGIVLAQLFFDGWKTAFAKKPDVAENVLIEPHPLPAKVLKKSMLGLNNLISDIVWLQTIQYYGGGDPNGRYRKLPEMINLTTNMDEKFEYPYTFGLVVMPGEGFPKEAEALGKKAMVKPEFKDDWEIPYDLAMVEKYNLKNDLAAAKYFEIASKRPGVPEMAAVMAGINYEKADQRLIAYALYEGIYKKSKNQYVKERAKQYMDHVQLVFYLEKAAQAYKDQFGQYPNDLQDLVTKKIVETIPADPLGRGLEINPTTGKVAESQK